MSQVSCIRRKRSKYMRSVLSKMNTNLRQTLTLSERSFTILHLFPFFIFPFPVTRSPIRFPRFSKSLVVHIPAL